MAYSLLVKRLHDLRISTSITTIYYLVGLIVPMAMFIIKIFFPIGDILTTIISALISLCGLAAAIACFFIKGTAGDNTY